IHMPGCRFIFDLSSESLIDERTVLQTPPPHRCVVDVEAALRHQLFNVPQAQRKPQIPTDAGGDDLWLKMASTEEDRSTLLHSVTLKTLPTTLQHFGFRRLAAASS